MTYGRFSGTRSPYPRYSLTRLRALPGLGNAIANTSRPAASTSLAAVSGLPRPMPQVINHLPPPRSWTAPRAGLVRWERYSREKTASSPSSRYSTTRAPRPASSGESRHREWSAGQRHPLSNSVSVPGGLSMAVCRAQKPSGSGSPTME